MTVSVGRSWECTERQWNGVSGGHKCSTHAVLLCHVGHLDLEEARGRCRRRLRPPAMISEWASGGRVEGNSHTTRRFIILGMGGSVFCRRGGPTAAPALPIGPAPPAWNTRKHAISPATAHVTSSQTHEVDPSRACRFLCVPHVTAGRHVEVVAVGREQVLGRLLAAGLPERHRARHRRRPVVAHPR